MKNCRREGGRVGNLLAVYAGLVGRTPWSAAGPLAGFCGTRASRADQGVRPTKPAYKHVGNPPHMKTAIFHEILRPTAVGDTLEKHPQTPENTWKRLLVFHRLWWPIPGHGNRRQKPIVCPTFDRFRITQ